MTNNAERENGFMKEDISELITGNESPVRTKLARRLNSIPDDKVLGVDEDEVIKVDEKRRCMDVLRRLPEDVIQLLNEDAIIPEAEPKVANTLELTLKSLAHHNMRIHQNELNIVLSGNFPSPSPTIMANAALRGDCDFRQGDQQNWWTLKIPRKFSPGNETVPSLLQPQPTTVPTG